jgi:aminopeptidase N
MQDASGGKPVVALMTPWTTEVGFPLLILPEDESNSIETPRFLASGPGSDDGGKAPTVWPIPVTAIVEGEDSVQGPWIINGPLGDESATLLDKVKSWTKAGKWFKLNASQAGFYRVSYTRAQWEKLAAVMSPAGPLSSTDRLGLISDSFAAGRAGYTSIVDSLRLVQNFGDHEIAGM